MPLSFNIGISSKTLYFFPFTSKIALSQSDCPVHFSDASQLQATSKEKIPKTMKLGQFMYSTTFERSQINYSIRSGEKMRHSNLT